MGINLNRLLKNSNINQKFYIALIGLIVAHVLYLFIFLLIDKIYLACMNIISIGLYVYSVYIIKKYQNVKLTLTITQIEIFLHSFMCTLSLGWGYGFQNITLALVSIAFFINLNNKLFGYIVTLTQSVAYLFLYVYFKDRIVVQDFESEAMYIFNFTLIVISLIFLSKLLRILNAIVYIDILEKQEQLQMAANKDPLTGLYNRRAFENTVCQKLINSSSFVSLVVGDLDNFKHINDSFGHAAGDEVLRVVSDIIRTSIRKDDYVCRWGGEEFLIALLNTDFKKSDSALNRIKEKIFNHKFQFNSKEVETSITFGFVHAEINEKIDIILAIQKADKLLYIGKRNGKNCVIGEAVDMNMLKKEANTANI
ncbi:GGDEF domain-containing protein [Campylobacter sp. RM16192]|uniref:GGDEF domain-containing protein n=1 Tax=Campylobacter sp. RM16192 TaxID=1660080 RepID=UPI00145248B6|nr:GGDEF domain-containing protein [Campylobacter sp. RM16192]QCD52198.1 diguanylate cyclase [Campylobacter sp. RM16192]